MYQREKTLPMNQFLSKIKYYRTFNHFINNLS